MTTDDESADEKATDTVETADETDHEDEHASGSAEYDPAEPTPPAREPPVRSTAPQSDYTKGQVALGIVIYLVGIALTFGLPLVMG